MQAMMTSLNGNIFRVIGTLCGNSSVTGGVIHVFGTTGNTEMSIHISDIKELSWFVYQRQEFITQKI